MEDNIQTIIIIIISAFLLFIFPVYMAYEKKDDISYALAIRYTQNLVDEVRSKGYISENMYRDYKARLKLTGNSYDIQMTHIYKRSDPVTNYYKLQDNKYILVNTTTQEDKNNYEEKLVEAAINEGNLTEESTTLQIEEYIKDLYKKEGVDKVEDTYKLSTEVYNTEHILNVLKSEKKLLINASSETVVCDDEAVAEGETTDALNECQYAYTMNVDDNFNIRIKNTNVTLATVIYNMITANALDVNTRIYVNYGGDILSSKWHDSIDYAKMKHDDLSLTKLDKQLIFEEERHFFKNYEILQDHVQEIEDVYTDNYAIEFDVKPEEVTQLKNKGPINVVDYVGYNFAIGNGERNNPQTTMSVSVGLNGVSIISNNVSTMTVTTIDALQLPKYTKTIQKMRIIKEEYTYIDEATGETKVGLRDKEELYEENILVQSTVDDYTSFSLKRTANDTVTVNGIGDGIPNFSGVIKVQDDNMLLSRLDKTIKKPYVGTMTSNTPYDSTLNSRGIQGSYYINMEETSINITAEKVKSNEMTILSYPTSINNYVRIKLEVKDGTVALMIDGEKVAESIKLDENPIVNIVGKTVIGSEIKYFTGYIKNVRMYKII